MEKKPRRRFESLIINILSSLIFAIALQPIINILMDSGGNTQIIVNHVRQQIQILVLDSFDSADLHIVCNKSVALQKFRHHRAPTIATLHAGCVVRKIGKIGKWMHVEWTNPESGANMQGWMLSKYLDRVDRKKRKSRNGSIAKNVE